ncbi:hypothetical protein BH24CHL2_BH24CHL2_5600 [soil metagenome]
MHSLALLHCTSARVVRLGLPTMVGRKSYVFPIPVARAPHCQEEDQR